MKVAVFGLGYVGCVSAACLADLGHTVVGVDVNPLKLELVAAGKSPVLEPALEELIGRVVHAGRLRVSGAAAEAVTDSDVSLICVGTPPRANGSSDLTALERTSHAIGKALASARARHTVVVRSTTPPGTCWSTVLPILESSSGRRAGSDFGFAMNPEFLREGSSVLDFQQPAKTVIGEIDKRSGDPVERLYAGLPGPRFRVPLEVAEMAKYTDNAFHALKVVFANEIGVVCRELGVDAADVMNLLCADTKLNISTAYLRPGFAFGGSCLSKDLQALLHETRHRDLDLPLLGSILPSNRAHLRRLIDLVVSLGRRKVGIVGLAFKPGTDDLRDSPLVEVSEQLLGKGFDLRIHDPAVSMSQIVGANREFIDQHIPHLSALLVDSVDELREHSDLLIIGSDRLEGINQLANSNKCVVIDLVRVPDAASLRHKDGYIGVAW